MRNHRWGALALVCALGVLPACGNAGAKTKNDAKGGPSGTPSATPSGTAAATSGTPSPGAPGSTPGSTPGSSVAPSGSAAASGKPAASGSPSATPSPWRTAPLVATLAKQCATPGSTQTLNLQTAPKPKDGENMIVVFDTLYPDGKDGKVYGGIDTNGRANNEGAYVNTWVIALNAPTGQARVDIAVAGEPGTATKQIYFDIKKSC